MSRASGAYTVRSAEPLTALQSLYESIEKRALESLQNAVPLLPVELDATAGFHFLPASSIAIQSLIEPQYEPALQRLAAEYQSRFPEMAGQTFWQPPGTFHLNVAILRRLSATLLDDGARSRIIAAAAPVLAWLDEQPAYEVVFDRVLLAADGTLMVAGIPASSQPWAIRDAFIEAGFPDQQRPFHVTIGRVLSVLPADEWRRVVQFTLRKLRHRTIVVVRIRRAILVSEREGFLHAPSAYDIVRSFAWR
jgi:hypothetical protein